MKLFRESRYLQRLIGSTLSGERLYDADVSRTNGRISYFCLYRNNDGARFEVAVMNDYDAVERTWMRSCFTLQSERPDNWMPSFHGFWKDSEMILTTELPEQLLTVLSSYKYDN